MTRTADTRPTEAALEARLSNMPEIHTTSEAAEAQGYGEAAGTASQVEFIGADELKARLAANDADDEDDEKHGQADAEEIVVPKKKRKARPPKPTGFEDYHADAPVTPDEHAKERELYHKFVDWISMVYSSLLTFMAP